MEEWSKRRKGQKRLKQNNKPTFFSKYYTILPQHHRTIIPAFDQNTIKPQCHNTDGRVVKVAKGAKKVKAK